MQLEGWKKYIPPKKKKKITELGQNKTVNFNQNKELKNRICSK